jgi:DNA polymerase I-like protein with 3'-5' exonuclease and polymerase domains
MTPEEAIRRIEDETTKELVLDVETSGLDWRVNDIVGWVLTFSANPKDSLYVPVRHAGGGNFLDWPGITQADMKGQAHPFEASLYNALWKRGKSLRTIGHNYQFDMMMAHGRGIDLSVNLVEDTSVNQPMINEFARSFSLSSCCKDMGVQEKKGEELYEHLARLFGGVPDRNQMGNFWRLRGDDPIGVDYAEGDGTSTWQLLLVQRKEISRQEMDDIHDIERRLTRTLFRMTSKGVRVDENILSEKIVEAERLLKIAQAFLPRDFNERSPKAVEAYFRAGGVTSWPMTEKGRPSFNKEWLKSTDMGRKIIDAREYSHLLNSFLYPLRDRHSYKGYAHPTFHQLRNDEFGTITGRLSCSAPNLQQGHKRNKKLGLFSRSSFVPEVGHIWRSADYSQCEPRLLAHYGNVRVLIDGYLANPPVDAHSAVAKQANIDRQSGKTLNQSLITGAGRASIVAQLGDNGHEIYDKYFEAMPEVKALQKRASEVMRKTGYVITLLGRRVRLEPPRFVNGRMQHFDYKAVNRLLQTGNADVIKKAMVEIDNLFESDGDACRLLNNVHDSLDFSFPEDGSKDSVMQEALKIMVDFGPNKSVFLRVPLGIEYGDGKNWAEATWPKTETYLQ